MRSAFRFLTVSLVAAMVAASVFVAGAPFLAAPGPQPDAIDGPAPMEAVVTTSLRFSLRAPDVSIDLDAEGRAAGTITPGVPAVLPWAVVSTVRIEGLGTEARFTERVESTLDVFADVQAPPRPAPQTLELSVAGASLLGARLDPGDLSLNVAVEHHGAITFTGDTVTGGIDVVAEGGSALDLTLAGGSGFVLAAYRDTSAVEPRAKVVPPRSLLQNITTRSNVYAVWTTVGFFEVESVSAMDVRIDAQAPQHRRHRAFYIIDRSHAAWTPGDPDPLDGRLDVFRRTAWDAAVRSPIVEFDLQGSAGGPWSGPVDEGGTELKGRPTAMDRFTYRDPRPDSIWIDLHPPVQTMHDGRTFRPLFATLIVDLDGRLNVNAAGTMSYGDR